MKPLPESAVRERERQRIAQDIHDDLGQSLLTIKLDLCALCSERPDMRERLDVVVQNVDASILSLRAILCDLQPALLKDGLAQAMRRQLAELTRVTGIAHHLSVAPDLPTVLPPQMTVVALRVLQEALANLVRHARASHVEVALERQSHALVLRIQDDGTGFDQAQPQHGQGLRGMRARVASVGGDLQLCSHAGAGTCIVIDLPLPVQ